MMGSIDPIPGVEPTRGGYYLWLYLPSVPAAVIFLLLFLATTLYNGWRIYKTRAWYCLTFLAGNFFEVIGYAVRITAHSRTSPIFPFAIQNALILLAPALFAASIYMVLGRIVISLSAAKLSPIRPAIVTRTFVTGDILSLLIQGGAAGLMVIGNPNITVWGERMIIIGLVVQIVMFGVFGGIAGVFHWRYSKEQVVCAEGAGARLPWKRCLVMLYAVSVLIMARSVFRLVEYSMGRDGYALRHEWTMYVFDSLLMFLVTVLFEIGNYKAEKGPEMLNVV